MNKLKIYSIRTKYFLALLLFFVVKAGFSQTNHYLMFDPIPSPTGLTSGSMMSNTYNPALLNKINSPMLSVSVAPSRFGLNELSPGYVMISYPISERFSMAMNGFGIGNDLYNEFSGGLQSSFSISEYLTIGAAFEYFRMSIKDFNEENSYQVHLGAVIDINDYLTTGVTVRNISGSHYSGGENTSLQYGSAGFGFVIAPEFHIDLGVQVSTLGQSGFAFSAAYTVENIIKLRIGALTSPRIATAAVSILALPYIDLNIMTTYHDILGWSHCFGISIYFE